MPLADKKYSGSHYPPYCGGAGFVLSYDVVECFVSFFSVRNLFRIYNDYVRIIASKPGVTPIDHTVGQFNLPDTNYEDCYLVPNTLVQHRVVGQRLIKLFKMHSKDFY